MRRRPMSYARLGWVLCASGAIALAPAACSSNDAPPLTSSGGTTDAGGRDGTVSATDGAVPTIDARLPDGAIAVDSADAPVVEPDAPNLDVSIPDSPLKEAASDGAGKPTFDGGSAHVRWLHAAPDGVAVDICAKLSSASSYGAPMIGGAGLSFAHVTDFQAIPGQAYDVIAVPAPAADCSAVPVANLQSVALMDSMTIAYAEGLIPPLNVGYALLPFHEGGAPAGGSMASVRFHNVEPAAVDLFGIQGVTVTPWFTAVPGDSATGFYDTAAGSYSLRVNAAGSATVLVQVDNVALGAGAAIDAFVYSAFPSNVETPHLLRCPVSGAATCTND